MSDEITFEDLENWIKNILKRDKKNYLLAKQMMADYNKFEPIGEWTETDHQIWDVLLSFARRGRYYIGGAEEIKFIKKWFNEHFKLKEA